MQPPRPACVSSSTSPNEAHAKDEPAAAPPAAPASLMTDANVFDAPDAAGAAPPLKPAAASAEAAAPGANATTPPPKPALAAAEPATTPPKPTPQTTEAPAGTNKKQIKPALNGKKRPAPVVAPIVADVSRAVLRGALKKGAFEGRWGFGKAATETSAFRYDARQLPQMDNRHEASGTYDGGFDLGLNEHKQNIAEVLRIEVDEVKDGRRQVRCEGDNKFGHFEMGGSCLEDGSDCVLVRTYAVKPIQRPRRRVALAPKRELSQRARQPARKKLKGKYGGKEPRFDPDEKEEVRSARTPSTRKQQGGRFQDVGRPLAEVFEAVAAAQQNKRVGVLNAPSRTIEEAAADIKQLLEPLAVPPHTRERLKSPQQGQRRPSTGKLRPFGCFDGDTAATTLLSEIDYERCLRDFQDAFERGHLADFWLAVEARLTQALEQAEAEGARPQIIRLDCGHKKGATALTPPPPGRLRRALQKPDNAPEVRGDLEPTNPGAYHVNTVASGFGVAMFLGIDGLAQGGKALACDSHTRCVALDTRVRVGSELDAYCDRLAATARVETVCSSSDGWRFGPQGQTLAGDEDRRHYLIAGWPGGLTPTHCDFGVQAVFYHTLAGKNRVLGVPRPVAALLHASREALVAVNLGGESDARLLQFEADALLGCLNRGLLQYDEFGPGETMLILPRGGHAVLTGSPYKVVLAGEWHLSPDGIRAAAIPRTSAQRRLRTRRDATRARDAAAVRRRSVESSKSEEDESQDEGSGQRRLSLERVAPAPAPIHTEAGRIAVYVEDAKHSALETGRADVDGERGPGFAAVAAAAARQANLRSKTVLHLRPSWNAKRWAACDAWDRIAIEADVEAARSLGVAEVVACPVTSKGLLDGAWCGKLVDAAKPSCSLVLGLKLDEASLAYAQSVGASGVVVASKDEALAQLCRSMSWSFAVVRGP